MATAAYQTSWILELVDKLSTPLLNIDKNLMKVEGHVDDLGQNLKKLDPINIEAVANSMRGLHQRFTGFIQPGIAFQDSMLDMQAITGVTDEKLAELGESARKTAKALGGDAAGAIEVSKLLLSQLTPELADKPQLLEDMTRGTILLSKTMAGDTAAATMVLTTAMNQYGVDLQNPILASAEMNRMMNIMSAGAKEGSAELPQIGQALANVGGDAKRANVAFEDTISAIEILDKYGKKGAEGGVALRNVLATLAQGRFLPQQVQEEMLRYGVNIDLIGNKNVAFSDRLRELQKIQGDSALITKLFGKENQLGAAALIENADALDTMTSKIINTNTTVEQAETIMGGYTGLMQRGKAWIADFGISLFNMTENFVPFINGAFTGIDVLADLKNASYGVSMIMNSKLGASIRWVGAGFKMAALSSWAFVKSTIASGYQALIAGARYTGAAVVGLASYVVGLTAGTAAQWALNVAMDANPIGLIILGIVAIGTAVYGLIKYWDQVKQFMIDLGLFLWKINPFSWMLNLIEVIFPGFKDKLAGIFDTVVGWLKGLWETIKGLWKPIAEFFGFGDDQEMTISVKKDASGAVSTGTSDAGMYGGDNTLGLGSRAGGNGISGSGSAAGAGRNITMTLDITNVFNVASANMDKIEEMADAIVGKVNDKMRDALITAG